MDAPRLLYYYYSAVFIATYVASWLLLGDSMLPDGAGFALVLLYVVSTLLGKAIPLASKQLPPLLGMLTAGLVLRNAGNLLLPSEVLLGHTFEWWSRWLRAAALAVIMLRAGLGLDLDKLRKLGLATARLAFLPCLSEALLVLGLSGPVLGLPPAWGGTLGFVLAAVSPAVVVPGMLDLAARGYGTAKGVPTMVVAAASFDDVLAIAGFGICLALAASTETAMPSTDGPGLVANNASSSSQPAAGVGSDSSSLSATAVAWLVCKAPLELVAGIAFGVAYGVVAAAATSVHPLLWHGEWRGRIRSLSVDAQTCCVLVGALVAVFAGKRTRSSGGGALGAIVLGATASRLWPAAVRKPVQANVNAVWGRLQPALFGLLGAAVDVRAIEPALLGGGLGVIAAALALRIGVTRLALLRSGLTASEARLVCVAWLPKATVQAAVGGAALDLVQEQNFGADAEARGRLVLTLSVLVILLTAPVGALGIAIFGPLWLSHDGAADSTEMAPAPPPHEPAHKAEAAPGTESGTEVSPALDHAHSP